MTSVLPTGVVTALILNLSRYWFIDGHKYPGRTQATVILKAIGSDGMVNET